MTNFEILVKDHPEYVKKVLAHNLTRSSLKQVAEGSRHDYSWYNDSNDKSEMDFLNTECKRDVLDNIERKYLSNIIAPFRNKFMYISKKASSVNQCYILIKLEDDYICLPYFYRKSMYKGMVEGTKYTLDELGLQARPPLRSRFGNYLTKNKLCGSEAVREIGLRVFTSNAQYFNYTTGQGVLSRGKFAQN